MPAGAVSAPEPRPVASAAGFTPLELPDSGVRRYLERFGIGAIYIVAAPIGFPCVIGTGTDLGTELAAVRKTWPKDLDPPILVAAWWCFDLRTAQQIANLVVACDLLPHRAGSRFAVTVSEATTAITAAAGRLHFRLTPHATVLARAKAAGVALEDKLGAAQQIGGLKGFNAEYQRRRRAAQIAGRKFMGYSEARARFRALLAAAASGRPVQDVLAQVFES
jgi:hypothetical protein